MSVYMCRGMHLLAVALVVLPGSAFAFLAASPIQNGVMQSKVGGGLQVSKGRDITTFQPLSLRRGVGATVMKIATLSAATEWTLSLSFTKEKDASYPTDVTLRVSFVEDEGYEPPQGRVKIQPDSTFLSTSSGQSFWRLGEDPAKEGFDKAGFWIWGLFEEPKYPFFFFELDVIKEIQTASGVIPVGKLFAEAQVTRTKEQGVVLSQGKLTVKEYSEYQADLIGLSSAKLGADVPCGVFAARPLA